MSRKVNSCFNCVLHKVNSWLLEAAEKDTNKTHNENNGDFYNIYAQVIKLMCHKIISG